MNGVTIYQWCPVQLRGVEGTCGAKQIKVPVKRSKFQNIGVWTGDSDRGLTGGPVTIDGRGSGGRGRDVVCGSMSESLEVLTEDGRLI